MNHLLLIYFIILAGIFSAIGQYVDKHLVNKGITRKDYFYYMCLSMIPLSIIMVIINNRGIYNENIYSEARSNSA